MKITETIERECCQSKDLKAVNLNQEFFFCIHCGQYWKWVYVGLDNAGLKEYYWQMVNIDFEKL